MNPEREQHHSEPLAQAPASPAHDWPPARPTGMTAAATASLGSGLLQRRIASRAVQRQATSADPATPLSLQNPRFGGDATLEAVLTGKQTLRSGARGASVRRIQGALEDLGFALEKFHKDAAFGGETVKAVTAFQAAHVPTAKQAGVVDSETLQQLDAKTPHASAAVHTFREAELNGYEEGETPVKQTALQNPRFQGDPVLTMLATGIGVLDSGSKRPHIWKIQRALEDLNFKTRSDGTYDATTGAAVKGFQEAYNVPTKAPKGSASMGEEQKGKVGGSTIAALDAYAPRTVPEGEPPKDKHPGQRPKYEELFADGKFEMTLAIGYDDNMQVHVPKKRQAMAYLQNEMGFKLTDPRTASQGEIKAAGLDPDTVNRELIYFTKDFFSKTVNKSVHAVIKLLVPDQDGTKGAQDLALFKQGLEQDDAVLYTGHARAGTGPDFDSHDSQAGNYVMGAGYSPEYNKQIKGAENQLDKTKFSKRYQLLNFWGCTTENYDKHLKKHLGKKGQDVLDSKDIVLTSHPVLSQRGIFGVLAFLQGVLAEQSAETLQDMMNMSERGATANMHGFNK